MPVTALPVYCRRRRSRGEAGRRRRDGDRGSCGVTCASVRDGDTANPLGSARIDGRYGRSVPHDPESGLRVRIGPCRGAALPGELDRSFRRPVTVAVTLAGAAGTAVGTSRTNARMKSFSSWPRMWQCQTYSQPKLVAALEMLIAFPSSGFVTDMLAVGGMRHVQTADAVGNREGKTRLALWLQRDDRIFQRVHPDGFLPAQLVVVGRVLSARPSRPG